MIERLLWYRDTFEYHFELCPSGFLAQLLRLDPYGQIQALEEVRLNPIHAMNSD